MHLERNPNTNTGGWALITAAVITCAVVGVFGSGVFARVCGVVLAGVIWGS